MNNSGFYQIMLPLESNLFHELSNSIEFEQVTKGRMGNHLVNVGNMGIPIVRTTTKYNIPAHNFSPTHHKIVDQINNTIQNNNLEDLPSLDFNNALIEIYNQHYYKMKYHSDQCLDMEANSYIGLFSCYENPEELSKKTLRKLKIKNKTTEEEFEISLAHNSVVLFSLSTNSKFLHKIVLEPAPKQNSSEPENRWLGITLRKSKTLIQFKDKQPYFSNGKPLELADETQQKEFYKLRGQENRDMDFVYPELTYTLSEGDLLSPKLD